MDRSLECHREFVRKTMMKQEQVFKQQVCELHWLYKVQKTLMAEVGSKEANLHSLRYMAPGEITDKKNRVWSSVSFSDTSHSSYTSIRYNSAEQLCSKNSFQHIYNTKAGPSSRELRICSEDLLSKQKAVDLKQPTVDDDGGDDHDDDNDKVTQNESAMLLKHLKGKTSIEGPKLYSDGVNDIDLTLSIGHGTNKNNPKSWFLLNSDLDCSMPPHCKKRQLILNNPVRLEGREERGDPSKGLDGEGLQEPPWLFQTLNLNRR